MTLSVQRFGFGEPFINAKHVDGPLLIYSDGQLHWLTWRERIAHAFGLTDAWEIQCKRRPDLAKRIEGVDHA